MLLESSFYLDKNRLVWFFSATRKINIKIFFGIFLRMFAKVVNNAINWRNRQVTWILREIDNLSTLSGFVKKKVQFKSVECHSWSLAAFIAFILYGATLNSPHIIISSEEKKELEYQPAWMKNEGERKMILN